MRGRTDRRIVAGMTVAFVYDYRRRDVRLVFDRDELAAARPDAINACWAALGAWGDEFYLRNPGWTVGGQSNASLPESDVTS